MRACESDLVVVAAEREARMVSARLAQVGISCRISRRPAVQGGFRVKVRTVDVPTAQVALRLRGPGWMGLPLTSAEA
jgi:hypothetical protein